MSASPDRNDPRRHFVTTLFSDLLGFEELAASVGVDHAYSVVTGCLRLVDETARRHGGSVDKYLGDAIMAVFGYPIRSSDPATAALRAASEIHQCVAAYNREHSIDPPLGVHTGVNSGEVIFGALSGTVIREFHVLGDSVNVAARLKAKAPTGSVFVGGATYEATKAGFEFRSMDPLPLKGKTENVAIYELQVPERSDLPRSRGALATHSVLVGRDEEMRTLERAMQALEAGHGGVSWIEGERGAGKSRLIAEATSEREEVEIFRGRALGASEGHLHPFAQILRAWAGIAHDESPEVSMERLRAAVASVSIEDPKETVDTLARLLGASNVTTTRRWRPRRHSTPTPDDPEHTRVVLGKLFAALAEKQAMVVTIEDLQRTDAESLDLLISMTDLTRSHPIHLLLSADRPAPPSLRNALDALREHGSEHVTELRLGPLDPDAAQVLLANVLGEETLSPEALSLVQARGAGNPSRLIQAAFLAPALQHQEADQTPGRERSSEAERRRATVLFADLSGFTAMTERLDPAETYAIVNECLHVLDDTAQRHGGTVEKHLGDCVLGLYGVPVAVEDAPRAAVNAAIEMLERIRAFQEEREIEERLDVHVGVATGLAVAGDVSGPVLREFAVMGPSVKIADRLKDDAPSGRVWVDAETRRSTQGAFEYERVPSNQTDVPDTWELISTRQRLYRTPRGAGSLSSVLVGRHEEMNALRERVRALRAGQGGIADVVGEAGLGKTRLRNELIESPDAQGIRFLVGRSISIGANLSFHPFADLLRSWLRISDDLVEEQARERLDSELRRLHGEDADEIAPFLGAVMGFVPTEAQRKHLEAIPSEAVEKMILRSATETFRKIAEESPVVLLFEDLHWADQSSIELLESLLRLVKTHPILIFNVFRPGHARSSDRILEAVRQDYEDVHCDLRLAPLGEADVRAMIDNLFRSAELPHKIRQAIVERAAGNPFYVEEVARSLFDSGALEIVAGEIRATERMDDVSIPGTIREIVMARIDRRPLRQRQLIQLAAVVGQSFHFDVLVEVLGEKDQTGRDLEDLDDAGFVSPVDRYEGREFGFRHPLLQEVAYDTLVADRREGLHRSVAEAIEVRLTENTPGYYGMLAYHYGRARDTTRVEDFLLRAGDDAARLAASSEALHFFQEALAVFYALHGEGGSRETRATLEKKIATALHFRGQFQEATEHFDEALRLTGVRVPSSQPEVLGRFAWNFAKVLARLYLRPGHRPTRPAEDRQREAIELMYARAEAQTITSPTRFVFDGMDTLARLQRVDATSVPSAGRMYSGTVGIFSYGGLSFDVSRRFLALANELVEDNQPDQLMMVRAMNLCHHQLEGDWSNTQEAPDDLVEESLSYGRLWEATTYLGLLAEKLVYRGDMAAARERREQIYKIWDLYQYDLAKTNYYFLGAVIPLQEGRLEEALLGAQAYHDENPEDLLHILALGTKAKVQILMDDLEGAEASLTAADRLAERNKPTPPWHHSAVLRSHLLLALTRLERALAAGDRAAVRRLGRVTRKRSGPALSAATKVAWRRTEVYRLSGLDAWLRGRFTHGLRWWQRSIAEAQRLGAEPELGRTYLEVARRLGTLGGPSQLEGTDASVYLDRADAVFEKLGFDVDRSAVAALRPQNRTR